MRESGTFPADLIAMEEDPLDGRRFGPGRVVGRGIGDVPGLVRAVALAAEVSEEVALNLTRVLLDGDPVVVRVDGGHRKLRVQSGSSQAGVEGGAGASDA